MTWFLFLKTQNVTLNNLLPRILEKEAIQMHEHFPKPWIFIRQYVSLYLGLDHISCLCAISQMDEKLRITLFLDSVLPQTSSGFFLRTVAYFLMSTSWATITQCTAEGHQFILGKNNSRSSFVRYLHHPSLTTLGPWLALHGSRTGPHIYLHNPQKTWFLWCLNENSPGCLSATNIIFLNCFINSSRYLW